MDRRIALVLVLLAALPVAASKRRAAGVPKGYPPCSAVVGTGGVTFTLDEGKTLAATSGMRGLVYTYGLAVLRDEPDAVMAWHGNDLLLSLDAGCSWRVVASHAGWDFPPKLAAAGNGRVYAWSDNRRFLLRYDARGLKELKQPADFVGFAVDARNGDRLRAGGGDGVIYESRDAGESWEAIGRLEEATDEILYRVVFDARDLDHVVAGMTRKGAFVSRDGGRSWARASGMGKANVNAFHFEISPADSNYVYAMAIDLVTSGRHIYLSRDGGLTYEIVVTEEPGIKLVNGPTMAAHPTNRDVLYFVFGTATQGYGTDLFRFDLATRKVTVEHNDFHDIAAIAFSPKDPRVMYLGLVQETH